MFSHTRRNDNSRCKKPTAPHYSSDGGLALFHCGRTAFRADDGVGQFQSVSGGRPSWRAVLDRALLFCFAVNPQLGDKCKPISSSECRVVHHNKFSPPMTEMGQKRPWGYADSMSGLPENGHCWAINEYLPLAFLCLEAEFGIDYDQMRTPARGRSLPDIANALLPHKPLQRACKLLDRIALCCCSVLAERLRGVVRDVRILAALN